MKFYNNSVKALYLCCHKANKVPGYGSPGQKSSIQ